MAPPPIQPVASPIRFMLFRRRQTDILTAFSGEERGVRAACLMIGAAVLLTAEAQACSVELNLPDSCYAIDRYGNTIDGPGAAAALARNTATPTTASDATVKGPGPHSGTTPPQQQTPPQARLLPNLGNSISTISQPPPSQPATTSPPVYQRYPPGFTGVTGFTGNPSLPAATSRPGGISLRRAAAERMPLNFSIDGAFVKDGRFVLSGLAASHGSIDAAIFLTALRATCEGHDPYFSLDPDDISGWQQATQQGSEELYNHIKKDVGWSIKKGTKRNTPSIVHFRTISASRDYPAIWKSILAKYPPLRSRLVFGPEWLRETRFGEILYKADVLLKELAGGTPSLDVSNLRASKIPDYVSATQRNAARRLLYKHHKISESEVAVTGGRIWYDLSESSDVASVPPAAISNVKSELSTLLQNRGLLRKQGDDAPKPVSLQKSDGALDISEVYPRMYVRVRDPVSNRDMSGNFPGIDEVVIRANGTPQRYAAAYKEYQALVEVFRAYVAAVYATRRDSQICKALPGELLPAEKTDAPLPKYHPTELSLTVGWYEYSDGRMRRAEGATSSLFQGGVSVGASVVLNSVAESDFVTPILREIKSEVVKASVESKWTTGAGRHFIAFALDIPEESKPVTRIALAKGDDFGPPVLPVKPSVPPSSAPVPVQTLELAQAPPQPPQPSMQPAKPVLTPGSGQGSQDLIFVAVVLTVALLALLLRLRQVRQKPALQRASVFAMPDHSSPDSIPYVQPRVRDSLWAKQRSATSSTSTAAQEAAPESANYASIERDFKNVFAIKSMADRETMIRTSINIHGGTRAAAMERLVAQWRHDNRA
ncbi:MAG: hypothetical protein JWR80_4348 [Bradyrhizobium sp.]|nr:hypothetical protein [Bradyrhizobium sp.]